MPKSISAEVLAYSENPQGAQVLTVLATYPRFIHSEVMTHRVFERNGASSRAIPVLKTLKEVWLNPACPVRWGAANKGMTDKGPLPDWRAKLCRRLWLTARLPIIAFVWIMMKLGLAKQVSNRLLEPWTWMTLVITATEWENFYRLRISEYAQPEIKELALRILEAHAAATPKKLAEGDWHIPFDETGRPLLLEERLKIATARIARTSYLNFYGKNDIDADIKMTDKLYTDRHFSPFGHCCRAENDKDFHAHLRGFSPHRKVLGGDTYDQGGFDPKALLEELGNGESQVV